jgi:predicted alpha/beta superfamily hydrolase
MPVVYMHDGQNIIDPRTSFAGIDWQMDEVADSLIRQGAMEEIIIVGISSSPDRMLEYSDTTLGRAYASFVVNELKPLIDSTYRTRSDRRNTAVMGSSMGGLISFLFVWWHPEVFSKAACLSSAFLWEDNKVLHQVESAKELPHDIAIYLDCGTAESRLLPGFKQMHKLLGEKGLIEGKTLMGFLDEGATHNERAWARRVWRPLVFFFPH